MNIKTTRRIRVHMGVNDPVEFDVSYVDENFFRGTMFAMMREGFRYADTFYPAHVITRVEIVKDTLAPAAEKKPAAKKPVSYNCKGKRLDKKNPDDMCKDCNCWKMTRKLCG